jgi:preprotein translocase subunit SecG
MLYYLIVVLYVLVCLFLIGVILLQQGKGGDIANAFGGGSSQAVFGARSGATLLTRATSVLAALFVVLSLVLTAGTTGREFGRRWHRRAGASHRSIAGDDDTVCANGNDGDALGAARRAGRREPGEHDAAGGQHAAEAVA